MKFIPLLSALCLSVLLSWTSFSQAAEGDLNINTATAQEIANALVGVGSVKAQAIIALRDQLGGFTDINQLLEV
ncbi:MAG: helix-hairpin-helix domain-containing protein, partial [Gammaproteobacteria bacterium]|nr:helix-hairpin-helix domain-containing protein [Gammaproteobacteria bacterium]